MKWIYTIAGVLAFLIIVGYMDRCSRQNADVQVIHSGAQP